jgi:hypothetical protein
MPGYADHLTHMEAELYRVGCLLRARLAALRASRPGTEEWLAGSLTEAEAEQLLTPAAAGETAPAEYWLAQALMAADAIASDLAQTDPAATDLRLVRLARLLHLSPFAVDALLLSLLTELDPTAAPMLAVLAGDPLRRRPTLRHLQQLFCSNIADIARAREAVAPDSPLSFYGLIETADDPHYPHAPLPDRPLRLSERIAGYLLGAGSPDGRLAAGLQTLVSGPALSDLILSDREAARWQSLVRWTRSTELQGPLAVLIHGARGAGKRTLFAAFCREVGASALLYPARVLEQAGESAPQLARLLVREALLQGACPALTGFEAIAGSPVVDGIMTELCRFPGPVFLLSQEEWQPGDLPPGTLFWQMAAGAPDYPERLVLWQAALGAAGQEPARATLEALANQFRLTPGQIGEAVRSSTGPDWSGGPLAEAELFAAARSQAANLVGGLARKIEPTARWQDLVLPREQTDGLEELIAHVRFRQQVYGQWGFGRRLSRGKGLTALFAGPSGTGKTMAAEVIAGALGLDLYQIDLSAVVSKYIGETEKNLSRIFAGARAANAILFFDEADALFGKRSEVKDAHDRYANIEVGYLLQQMELYDGLAILATNLSENLDEAFLRRMQAVIRFPFPDEELRLQIWQSMFPAEAPLAPDVDLVQLAAKYKLAGGHIKNVAVAAAFLAAAEGSPIAQRHLVRATRQEFQKIGRTWGRED